MNLKTHNFMFPAATIYNFAVYPDSAKFGRGTIIGANTVIRDNVTIGDNTIIGPLNVIESNARIGNNVTIQPHGVIAVDTIIQDNVFIGPHFSCANNPYIPDGEHGTSPEKKPYVAKPIVIKEGARIGTRCTVAPGVTIGRNCFIKMNCNIYTDVPDDTVLDAGTYYTEYYQVVYVKD